SLRPGVGPALGRRTESILAGRERHRRPREWTDASLRSHRVRRRPLSRVERGTRAASAPRFVADARCTRPPPNAAVERRAATKRARLGARPRYERGARPCADADLRTASAPQAAGAMGPRAAAALSACFARWRMGCNKGGAQNERSALPELGRYSTRRLSREAVVIRVS